MVERVTHTFTRTLGRGIVRLTVTIGDGQLGGSSLKLDRKRCGPVGDLTGVRIGKAAALDGHALEVRTLVADVNLQSNRVSVTYTFTGVAPRTEVVRHRIKRVAGAVLVMSTFRFARATDERDT